MATITSTANGNWSAGATWVGGVAPGIGDTAVIAHTVTVDADITVGTSPNDTTTKVVTVNTTKSLLFAAGKTLTVRGSIAAAFQSFWTMAAGSAVVFDNSASGGSPIYSFPANFVFFTITGTANSHCSISAIVGQAFTMNSGTLMDTTSITYLDVTRMNASTWGIANSGAKSFTFCTFTSCGKLTIDDNNTAVAFNFNDNRFVSTTGSLGSLTLTFASSAGANARNLLRNVADAYINYGAKDFTILNNYFGGGFTAATTKAWTAFRNNFVRQDGSLNGGNGQLICSDVSRSYFVVENVTGNPHFLMPQALGANTTVSQSIFEAYCPDLIDVGDCLIAKDTATSGGGKIIGQNCIALKSSYPGATTSCGTFFTLYNLATGNVTESYRNTCNVNVDATQSRGCLAAVAESSTGFAGQVAALKSNIAWSNGATQGALVYRETGTVKDIITAAGADYNWTYNTITGDNQRGYEDRAASGALWTAGDAVAAGADTHQGTGNPQFHDSARNLAAWATARGYGSTYANALTALQAVPSRVADLIAYVFEGFRPTNASCRNAAHDGGCVGAANFAKTARVLTAVTTHRGTLSKFGIS